MSEYDSPPKMSDYDSPPKTGGGKKDRTMFEPLQFYTGRDRRLYELVVFTVDKGKVSGYVSTPKEMVTQVQ